MKAFRHVLPVMMGCVLLLAQPALAFTNGSWTQVTGYETRVSYHVDQGETVQRLVDLYYTLDKSGVIRADAEAYFRGLFTTDEGVYNAGAAVTKGALTGVLYQMIQKMYPDLDLSVGNPVTITDTVPESLLPAAQFLLSRSIVRTETDGSFSPDQVLTLGGVMEMLDQVVNAAPDFTEVVPPAPVLQPETPASAEAPKAPETQTPVTQGKNVYLTFDDSTSENTSEILDILKKNGIHATFFIAGKSDPELIKRMVAEGHAVGVHTMTHDYGKIYTSTDAFWADIEEEAAYLEGILGYRTKLLRFPGGSNNAVSKKYSSPYIMPTLIAQAAEKGYIYFDWNASAGDAAANTVAKDTLVANAIKTSKGKNNVILLMHQTKPKTTTPEALPEIIQWYRDQGYTFQVLSETSFRSQFTLPQ